MMFASLMRLHLAGKLTPALLAQAVERGWITPEQAEQIAEAPLP